MFKFAVLLALFLAARSSSAAFDPALNAADNDFLRVLLAELPGEILSRDPARIAAVESHVANFALEARAKSRADLELAVDESWWSYGANEARWMIGASLSMIDGIDQDGKGTAETDAFRAALLTKRSLLARTESTLNTADPANLPELVPVLASLLKDDGHKLSEIYLRLRALYVPLHLAPALPALPLAQPVLRGLDNEAWDATLNAVEREVLASRVAEALPVSARASFEKSILDLFFTVKFPLLDLGYGAILDPQRPNPALRPDGSAAEALSSLRSLERVLLLTDVFRRIDQAGGPRAYLRSIQPKESPVEGLCSRLPSLSGFTADDWKRIRASGKVLVLDPGHLGGEFADDARDVSPPAEKGQESYGYREGHDTFVIANLARALLTQCAKLPEANVLLTRRGLHDEGGFYFDKTGNVAPSPPGPNSRVSDNLYFRKVVISFARPDFVISMHTDYSDTLTQHGLIVVPHDPSGLGQGFYKSRAEYEASLGLARLLARSLGQTMFEAAGTPSGKSAHDFLGFEFREYYLKDMDLQIYRDVRDVPVALVEGYDYASPEVRALMNGVARGHRTGDPDVKTINVDGVPFFYHTVHRSYAEGVALAALRFLLEAQSQPK